MSLEIPSYYLFDKNTNINIEEISYDNPYDFTELHRHQYFELMFFETGGGTQVIDFNEYEIREKGIYLICPGQIHLMKRKRNANGIILQFTNEFLMNKNLPWNILSQGHYIQNDQLFDDCFSLVQLLKNEYLHNETQFKKEIISDFLKIILMKLFAGNSSEIIAHDDFVSFVTLLESKFKDWNTVQLYLKELNITSKKLNALTKKHLGKTALQVIHDRILLEAKRMMITSENASLKEISYLLNFDSQASFSNFIKKRTGYNPTELQKRFLEL